MTCACGDSIFLHTQWNGVTSGCTACGCRQYEIDDGTDTSPTVTGSCAGQAAFPYNGGKYGGHYEI